MTTRRYSWVTTILLTTIVLIFLFVLLLMSGKLEVKEFLFSQTERIYISGILVERDLDDLSSLAEVIATGTVTNRSDAFQIKNVSGQIANFTDYSFEVSNSMKGAANTDTLTIRVQGGAVGSREEIYEHSPDLIEGQSYLLFLYRPGRGGSYNTEGDYYYILGLTQGTFTADNEGNYVSDAGVLVTQEMLTSFVSAYSMQADENGSYFRNEYIENQKRNLQNGVITQEQYDYLMNNIDTYATIIE